MRHFHPLGYSRLNGNANDTTVHGNNGTLLNGVSFTGPSGGASIIGDPNNQAAAFNIAQDQFIRIQAGTLFDIDWNQPLTMMIWVKSSYTTNNMLILCKEENSGNFRGPYIGGLRFNGPTIMSIPTADR